jgi:hypothetical protein
VEVLPTTQMGHVVEQGLRLVIHWGLLLPAIRIDGLAIGLLLPAAFMRRGMEAEGSAPPSSQNWFLSRRRCRCHKPLASIFGHPQSPAYFYVFNVTHAGISCQYVPFLIFKISSLELPHQRRVLDDELDALAALPIVVAEVAGEMQASPTGGHEQAAKTILG